MPFVLDTSVTMAWCFEDEATSYADCVLDSLQDDVALVPAIWPLEVANALYMGERRRRLQPADTARSADMLGALPITVDGMGLERALGAVLDVARTYQLTCYDAAYLELAMREGVPLATRVARLIAAAERAGVPLVQ